MKNKIVFKSQKDFVKWVTVSNMFAKSRIMPMVALKQFNSLKANQRKKKPNASIRNFSFSLKSLYQGYRWVKYHRLSAKVWNPK